MINEDFRLSVSKTKCFNQCKKQYEFNYILKLPKKTRDYHIFGKFCHKVLEDFHLTYLNDSNLPYNIVMGNAFKAAIVEYKKDMTPAMKKECWEIIDQYLRQLMKDKQNNISFNIIACERTFMVPLTENIMLNGAIDRVQLDADGMLHVADYKTTKNKKYLKDDWMQLLTYAYVLLEENPSLNKIRGSYILLRHNFEYITKEFSLSEILSIKDQYLQYAENMIKETKFAATTSPLCNWCDFQEHCIEGQSKMFDKKDQIKFGEVNW